MQVKLFNEQAMVNNEIVVFPAKVAQPMDDNGTTRYRYTNKIVTGGNRYKILSVQFDKTLNRVKMLCEFQIVMSVSQLDGGSFVNRVPAGSYSTSRSTMDVKLDIPRGAFGESYTSNYEIIEFPALMRGAEGKLRAPDGTVTEITSKQQKAQVERTVKDYLFRLYSTTGCPATCDRRKLPEPLKGYTGELRLKWRVEQKEWTYPASGLTGCILDCMNGWRSPEITLDKLREWGLIFEYPRMQVKCRRHSDANQMQTADFAGVYIDGPCGNTKNLQLATKLSRILGAQVTLPELAEAFRIFKAETTKSSQEHRPQLIGQSDGANVFFVGVTRVMPVSRGGH